MKHILFLIVCFGCLSATAFAGIKRIPERFDIITFKTPNGWHKKQFDQNTYGFGFEDEAKGIGCVIVMVKPVPGSDDSKVNFETAWETIVKKAFTITSGKPDIQPAPNINGWTAETGFGQAEVDGYVGLLMLLTLSGNNKMVNIITVTRTDACNHNITAFLDSIRLPELAATNSPSSHHSATQAQPSGHSNFTFATTDLNDGWKATEQSDWVHVSKGNTVVLIHYVQPNIKSNDRKHYDTAVAWDTIVAPRYSNISNLRMGMSPLREKIVEADATENATGNKVHVALYKTSSDKANWLEFITPDQESLRNQFPLVDDPQAYKGDTLAVMAKYNKFPVAASDLPGTWKEYTSWGGFISTSPGYTSGSISHTFSFRTGNDYTNYIEADHNYNYQAEKFEGKYTVSGWEMTLTNREKGNTETYDIHFEAVKGGRILHMNRTSPAKGLNHRLEIVK